MKPMTNEEINDDLTQTHANLLALLRAGKTEQDADRAMVGAIRAAFTLGQDNGQALVLGRVDELMRAEVADAAVMQLGKSMATVLAWVQALDGRVFTGITSMRDLWAASVMVAESEKRNGTWSRHSYGSTPAEALSVLATWCTEHDAQAAAVAS